jgi:flagellar biosynthesis/type III secretory pathway chaperone
LQGDRFWDVLWQALIKGRPTMNQVVSHATFRTLRACRSITQANGRIIDDLEQMRGDTERARVSLEDAGRRLEETLDQFDLACERLQQLNEQHESVMRQVDEIMENSPVFAQLRA